jgi:hypothetical protein
MNRSYAVLLSITFALWSMSVANAVLLGPSGGSGLTGEYAVAGDSPFAGLGFSYFYLENFEDHLFNVPGVLANSGGVASVVFGPTIHDSIDLDDGALDGSGLQGDDYFSASGATGITFTFDAAVLGALPTHAGIVWTDGEGATSFEAFDNNGVSLGTIGPVGIADGSVAGTTTDDRFFGAVNANGISAIRISNNGGGIEVDHLQYGLVPEADSSLILCAGLLGLWALRRSARRLGKNTNRLS